MNVSLLISDFIAYFFIQTPFFVLSMFLTLSKEYTDSEKRRLALRVFFAISTLATVIFFFGQFLFDVFSITVDAFRIGAGALLFLTAVDLVKGSKDNVQAAKKDDDIAVVPLAMPITVGPAAIGTIMVKGVELTAFEDQISSYLGLLLSIVVVGLLLFLSGFFEKILKPRVLNIISKITGLILSALASQMIFEGIKRIMNS